MPLGDGGLSHDVIRIIRDYGIVPESDYVQPENSGQMTNEVLAAMARRRAAADWNVEALVAEVREVLDRHLKAPPASITVDGRPLTPRQYATEVLQLELDSYWEVTSYRSIPGDRHGLGRPGRAVECGRLRGDPPEHGAVHDDRPGHA